MAHFATLWVGWTNERFAEIVLSQVSFVSRQAGDPHCRQTDEEHGDSHRPEGRHVRVCDAEYHLGKHQRGSQRPDSLSVLTSGVNGAGSVP